MPRRARVADLPRAIELNPTSFHTYLGRARAFELNGDPARAQADREVARRLTPTAVRMFDF
jgi:hypothetical protein